MEQNFKNPKKIDSNLEKQISGLEEYLGIKEAINGSDLNQKIVRHIIEECLHGNFDKAEAILKQKAIVEERQKEDHPSRLPKSFFEIGIPLIKEYIEENKLSKAKEAKQPLAENLKNIDSSTLPPDIQNVFDDKNNNIIQEPIMEDINLKKNTPQNTSPENSEPKIVGDITNLEETKTSNISKAPEVSPELINDSKRITQEMESDPDILAYQNRPKDLDILSDEYRSLLKKSIQARERIIKSENPQTKQEQTKSPDFLILEKMAEKEKFFWKKELAREFQNDKNNPIVKAFDENPYEWMYAELSDKITKLDKATQKAKTGNDREILRKKIIALENRLPPVMYMIKKDQILRFRNGDNILITENGVQSKYKIASIDNKRVVFLREGQTTGVGLAREAMDKFLLNPDISFSITKERVQKQTKKPEKAVAKTENENIQKESGEESDTNNEKQNLIDQAKIEYEKEISRIREEFAEKRKRLRESLATPAQKIDENIVQFPKANEVVEKLNKEIRENNTEQE